MTLLPIVVVAAAGAVASAAIGVDGRRGRTAVLVGAVALAAVLVQALALRPDAVEGGLPTGATPLDRLLVPTAYARIVIVLFAASGLLVAALGAITDNIRGLMPATLGTLAATAIALAAPEPGAAAVAAIGAGLAGLAVLGSPGSEDTGGAIAADRRPPAESTAPSVRPAASVRSRGAAGIATATATRLGTLALAEEARAGVAAGVAVLAAAAAVPVVATAVLAGPVDAGDGPGALGAAGAAPVVGGFALALGLGAAVRLGAIPFHLRVPRLADSTAPVALPVLLAWAPLPLAAAALLAADRDVASLALPLEGERAVLLALAVLTLVGGAVASWIRDDLRHVVGYLVVADGGFLLLGLAALDPGAWAPSRAWLLVLATSKTALAAWLAATEVRFGTRDLGGLRGWARRAPLLGVALAIATLATFGLPGWLAWTPRTTLPALAGGEVAGIVALLAGFATLPVYLRLLVVGVGRPSATVAGADPERFVRTPSAGVAAGVVARTAAAARANAALLASVVVLALAVLALTTAAGVPDLGAVAAHPAPTAPGRPGD